MGSAINSPFARSLAKMGSRSCWIAAWPVTYDVTPPPCGNARSTSSVYPFAFAIGSVETMSP
jgi:hypothetical protein